MKQDNNKIITISFLIAAFLAAVVVNVLVETLAASSGFVARLYAQELFRHVLPVVFGIATFGILQFNKKTLTWANEVVLEIRKVVWPSRRDTSAMTSVVCVMLAISCVILFVFDYFSREAVSIIIQ